MRQEKALRQAEVRLAAAESLIGRGGGDTELVAEELRQALHALEFLVGRVDLELVLDEVFAQFCLGK